MGAGPRPVEPSVDVSEPEADVSTTAPEPRDYVLVLPQELDEPGERTLQADWAQAIAAGPIANAAGQTFGRKMAPDGSIVDDADLPDFIGVLDPMNPDTLVGFLSGESETSPVAPGDKPVFGFTGRQIGVFRESRVVDEEKQTVTVTLTFEEFE